MPLSVRKNSRGVTHAEYKTFVETAEIMVSKSLKHLINQKAAAFNAAVKKAGLEVVGEIGIEVQNNFIRNGEEIYFYAEVRKSNGDKAL